MSDPAAESTIDPSVEEEDNLVHFLSNHFWLVAILILVALILMVASVCFLREYCWHKYRIEVCPGAAGSYRRRQEREQLAQDLELAQQNQEQLERELREARRLQKRKERRAKYEVFLEPYSMVVSEEHLHHSTHDVNPKNNPDYDVEVVGDDSSSGLEPSSHSQCSALDDHAMLTLPATTCGRKCRQVEALCAICLTEYEAGECVIWSSREQCPHAFHDECILTWLSKGKKRCPICRHFFVPGTAIDDKDVIVDSEADLTSHESNSSNNNDNADDEEESEDAIIEALRATRHSEPRGELDLELGSPSSTPCDSRHHSSPSTP